MIPPFGDRLPPQAATLSPRRQPASQSAAPLRRLPFSRPRLRHFISSQQQPVIKLMVVILIAAAAHAQLSHSDPAPRWQPSASWAILERRFEFDSRQSCSCFSSAAQAASNHHRRRIIILTAATRMGQLQRQAAVGPESESAAAAAAAPLCISNRLRPIARRSCSCKRPSLRRARET
jgi:hypothetical protein